MAQIQYAYAGELRDPRTAAMLSMIPGLGQFYNGQARKGFLFLDVAIINYMLLSLILLAPVISRLMQEMAQALGMKINHGIIEALQQMQFGSPVSLVVSGMIVAFIGYAVRDAYDHAQIRRRRALYQDQVIDLTEAASGSYILHASIIVTLAIMALFFFIPKPPSRQITEIEIFDSMMRELRPSPTVRPHDRNISNQKNIARIKKFDRNMPLQKQPPKSNLAKDTTQATSQRQAQTKPETHQAKSASSARASASAAPQRPLVRPVLIAQNFKPAAPVLPQKPVSQASSGTVRPAITPLVPGSMNRGAVAPATPAIKSLSTPERSLNNLAPRPLSLSNAGFAQPQPVMMTQGTFPAPAQQLLCQLAAGSFSHQGNGPVMPAAAAPGSGLKNALSLPPTGSIPQLGGGKTVLLQPGAGRDRSGGQFNSGTPGPVNIDTHQPGSGLEGGPVPQMTGSRINQGTKNSTGVPGNDNGPAPVRSGHGPGLGDSPIRIVPQFSNDGKPGEDTQSGPGNRTRNFEGLPGADKSASDNMPDFSRYMAEENQTCLVSAARRRNQTSESNVQDSH